MYRGRSRSVSTAIMRYEPAWQAVFDVVALGNDMRSTLGNEYCLVYIVMPLTLALNQPFVVSGAYALLSVASSAFAEHLIEGPADSATQVSDIPHYIIVHYQRAPAGLNIEMLSFIA